MAAIVVSMVNNPETPASEGHLTLRELLVVVVTLVIVLAAGVALILRTTSTVGALG